MSGENEKKRGKLNIKSKKKRLIIKNKSKVNDKKQEKGKLKKIRRKR